MTVNLICPLPPALEERIQLAHGGGGRLTQQLIDQIFRPAFRNPALDAQHDGAVLEIAGARLAFTTDSFVVRPLIFPGGNIGDLAVNGTVNDLAMCGARPLYLSAGFILEEGLPLETLRTVTASMRDAAREAGVTLVTGDTKVVDKGKGDGVFINTAGIGIIESPAPISPAAVQPGDAVIVSGDLGSHGIAILSVREGLEFEAPIESDTAPLWQPVEALLQAGIDVHCLRDLTRGGLAAALNEIATARRVSVHIHESAIPVEEPVKGACEILGLDPLYVANEGRFVAFVPEHDVERALAALIRFPACRRAARIGRVEAVSAGSRHGSEQHWWKPRPGPAERRTTPADLLTRGIERFWSRWTTARHREARGHRMVPRCFSKRAVDFCELRCPYCPSGGNTQTTIVSLWTSIPQQRRYTTSDIAFLLPLGRRTLEENRSFPCGLPTLRQEPQSHVPKTRPDHIDKRAVSTRPKPAYIAFRRHFQHRATRACFHPLLWRNVVPPCAVLCPLTLGSP